MNYLTLLFSFFTVVASAHLKQSEFEATMGLIGSEDLQKAQSIIEAFEKKKKFYYFVAITNFGEETKIVL